MLSSFMAIATAFAAMHNNQAYPIRFTRDIAAYLL
jgi:hypothetical protein